MCRWTFDSFDIDILSRKNFEGKHPFTLTTINMASCHSYAPNTLPMELPDTTRPRLLTLNLTLPPWSYVVYPSSYGGLVYSVLSGVERAMEDDSPISFSP